MKNLLRYNFINIETFANIVNILNYSIAEISDSLQNENPSDAALLNEKLGYLINHKLIDMNLQTLKFIKEHARNFYPTFIQNNIEIYIEILTTSENVDDFFDKQDFSSLLQNNTITTNQKLLIIENFPELFSFNIPNLSDDLFIHALSLSLDLEQIRDLTKEFTNKSSEIKNLIINFLLSNIEFLLENNVFLTHTVLSKLLESNDCNDNLKYGLMLENISEYSNEEIKQLLSIFPPKYSDIYDHNKRPRFTIDNERNNEKLLEILKSRSIILDFKPFNGFYTIQRFKHKKSSDKNKQDVLGATANE